MMRIVVVVLLVVFFGAVKLPAELALSATHRRLHFRAVEFDPGLREQIGQLGFVAALSGFRALVADVLFVQAHMAWERTEWGRVLLHFRQVTTLQPRALLFWDMAAWHMAWNASAAALRDPGQPRLALRIKAQREYIQLGKISWNAASRITRIDRNCMRRWLGCIGTRTKTTNMPPSFLRRRRTCPTRRATPGDSPHTKFPIVRAANGRPTTGCILSTPLAKRNGSPLSFAD